MAEPTLGQRIMDAAEAYANAVQEAIQTWGAGEWTGHHDEATAEELATLRALAARADAAERLAVAVDTAAGDREVNDWSYDARRLDEYNSALAAWRAINGEVADG